MSIFDILFGKNKAEDAAFVPAEDPAAETAVEETAEEAPEEAPEEAAEDVPAAAAEETVEAAETAEAESTAEEEDEEMMDPEEEAEDPAPAAEETPAEEEAEPAFPETAAESFRSDLSGLEPADVFDWFRQISAIPRGSFHTEAISAWLEEFALDRDLEVIRDAAGNVIIKAPATAGAEGAPAIILQGHMDMVCEKEADKDIDMVNEAISLLTDGEWLTADGTTLGADNGIAVAMMLAILDSGDIPHPALECVFTVDEEVGMLGAEALDVTPLQGRRMLNLDSEAEGVFTAGCAGGAEQILTIPARRVEKGGQCLNLSVSGLLGGHSGEMTGRGRANADKIMARLLYRLYAAVPFRLMDIEGGTKDNAIPRDCRARLLFDNDINKKKVKKAFKLFKHQVQEEYALTDPGMRFKAKWTDQDPDALYAAFRLNDTARIIRFLIIAPDGCLEYMPGFVRHPQTSLNLGILKTAADGVSASFLVRSAVNSQKEMVMDRLTALAEEFGGTCRTSGSYPAWQFVNESPFRELLQRVYRETEGRDAEVSVTHGGLECGLLAAKLEGLDCVSIGPDMQGIHTPEEKLNIRSTAAVWKFLKAALAACAAEEG